MVANETYITTTDQKKLFVQWFTPENYKLLVILVHGFGEHAARHKNTIEKCYANNIAVCTFDLRGHGKSQGKRGYAKKYNKFYLDIEAVEAFCAKNFTRVPVLMYGHSFGGALVINYCSQKPCGLAGMVISAPWFKLTRQPSIIHMLLARIIKIIPVTTARTKLDVAFLSRIPEVIESYKTDPLVHDKLSGKLFLEIVDAGLIASRSVYKLNLPVLIMHGTDDQVTSFKISEEFVRNSSENTELKLWEGHYHELHNDIGKEQVLDFFLNWVNKNILDT
jgi:acylglycerol lipase